MAGPVVVISSEAEGSEGASTVTIRIPMTFRMRGGRRQVIVPDLADHPPHLSAMRVDNPLARALGRAHRWSRLLEGNEYSSIADLAAAEGVDKSYLSKILRLTLLAPDVAEALLQGSEHPSLQAISLATLLKPFPVEWEEQKKSFLRVALRESVEHAARRRGA